MNEKIEVYLSWNLCINKKSHSFKKIERLKSYLKYKVL
ncbi:hypothetical protein FM130_11735 [Enterococcus faecium]|nr:hypothetical protein FM130_11735 [Enterococcus faecium]